VTDASEPAIFTPENEPYLGRPNLLLFDQVLLTLVAEQHRIGPWTRNHDLTPVQRAASEIVPGACSLAFSVRELVRQGYLLAARILLRPLIERVSTFTYLIDHDDAVTDWQSGWPHASQPSPRPSPDHRRPQQHPTDHRERRLQGSPRRLQQHDAR